MADSDGHVQSGGHVLNEFVQGIIVLIGNEIGLPLNYFLRGGQFEGIDQVINIDRMVEGLAIAKHQEDTPLHQAEEDQESPWITRTVDGGWTKGYGVESFLDIVPHDPLPFILRQLVVILRRDGGLLVSRGILYVTVDALGTAIDESADLKPVSGIREISGPLHIYIPIVLVRDVQLPKRGSEVIHHLTFLCHGIHERPICDACQFDFGSPRLELVVEKALLVIHHEDFVPLIQ
jgi:hypothetical protein